MPKDALGHGSNPQNGDAAAALASGAKSKAAAYHEAMTSHPNNSGPARSPYDTMSDSLYHSSMPIANYTSQVQDLLGLWSGTQEPAALSDNEKAEIKDAYDKRQSWRGEAAQVQVERQGVGKHAAAIDNLPKK